ncbi:hypothetical protein LZP69_01230 [Shewanella sp. AS1]|uniref:hypothetical protein n=1 Tax=Shewanella sp. AS1 TaxID=2907626 RepID=UPI001F3BA359|nr:hypothetical protein [Shewanella sp. AS1]MCE9677814.1 hypothetical protein [Shewanella sp. AS1]
MKKSHLLPFFILSFTLLPSQQTMATPASMVAVGLGVEYGGLGAQVFLPVRFDNLELYLSAGLMGYSSPGDHFGGGGGIGSNLYFAPNHSLGLYAGVVSLEREHDPYGMTSGFEYKVGGSLNYKFHFAKKGASGGSLGVSYNVYDGGSYPFISLGYRF